MSADSIAISRELVREGGLEQKAADIIAQKIVAHFDANAASKAELAEVKAKMDADRQARVEKETNITAEIVEIKSGLGRVESDISGLKAAIRFLTGIGIAGFIGIVLLVIERLF